MTGIQWFIVIALTLLGLGAWGTNAHYIFKRLTRPDTPYTTLAPIGGGVAIALAMLLVPLKGWGQMAWIPLAIDPGLYILYLFVATIIWRAKGKPEPSDED